MKKRIIPLAAVVVFMIPALAFTETFCYKALNGEKICIEYSNSKPIEPQTPQKTSVVGGGGGGHSEIRVFDDILAQISSGSLANLRNVNTNQQPFGVVQNRDLWLGRKGKINNDPNKYDNVLAVSWLYSKTAHLVVRKDSGIKSVKDLVGKKVGVSNVGSSAFDNCKLFFSHMGVWDKIDRKAMRDSDAATAFGNNQLDAFWLFTFFPSGAVIRGASTNKIDLINLVADAKASRFFDKYPNFGKTSIPADTYKGIDQDVPSFHDSAVLVAHKDVPDDVVHKLLSITYSKKKLKYFHDKTAIFRSMCLDSGATNIVTPFHSGSIKFWKEKGKL